MYPQEVDKFTEKFNKVDNNIYVVEEEINLINGVYEGELKHDNVNISSISVWTGPKFTGQKVENFLVSTPSKTPWKKIIKIFSSFNKVYITYETDGDTVEAEDINKVQESIVNTQIEVDRYKSANDLEVSNLKVKATNLENNKAAKVYVDTELNKRYLKTETYNKEETDQRIQAVISVAPAALDTLKEIADALNNDPNFAGTMTLQLANKVDKVSGKQLSTNDYTTAEKTKLAGIATGANNYTHPATHPPSIVVQDSSNRFVTDVEKANWNDASSRKHDHTNKTIIDTITQTLLDAWNSAVTHISDTIKHITSAERTLWNTVSDKSSIGHTHDDRYYTETETDTKYVAKTELSNYGYGDMMKSIYDTNNNGIVDNAEKLGGKVADDFAPSGFGLGSICKQATVDWNNQQSTGFYRGSNLANQPPAVTGSHTWWYVLVMSHDSSNWISQLATDFNNKATYRRAKINGVWSSWVRLYDSTNALTWDNLKGV